MEQTFYQLEHLSLNQKIELLNRAARVGYKIWVDVRKSGKVARESSDLSITEVLMKVNNSCHFVFIDRGQDSHRSNQHYFETGFSTLDLGDNYFLFIYLEPQEAEYLIQSFNLSPR